MLHQTLIPQTLNPKPIQEGKCKAPYDMEPTHRQFNPLYLLDKGIRFINEATGTGPIIRNSENKKL